MTSLAEITGLIQSVEARAAEFRARPDFWRGVRALAEGALDLNANTERPLRHVMKDKGGFLLTLGILYTCYTEPAAATAAFIKLRVARLGIASQGRLSSFIDHMRRHGLLRPSEGSKSRILMLGAPLEAYHLESLRVAARALPMCSLEAVKPEDIGQDWARAYVMVAARFAEAVYSAFGQEPSGLALFGERNAGMLIVYRLLTDMPGDRPEGEAHVSVSGLARTFEVSRPHVLKLLQDAQVAGFLTWDRERRAVGFTPQLLAQFEAFFSGFMAFHEAYLRLARESLSA